MSRTVEVARCPLTEILLLDDAQRLAILASIDALRERWLHRSGAVGYYTLGASAYLDGDKAPGTYTRMAREHNPILIEHFAPLYDMVAETIEKTTGMPVEYSERFARPGFHIFLADDGFQNEKDVTLADWLVEKHKPAFVGNPIHCDTAHYFLDWTDSWDVDMANPISFTVTFELPSAGHGIDFWDLTWTETSHLPPDELKALLAVREKVRFNYTPGRMVFHSGLHYHQVAPLAPMKPGERRITLQGHGLRCDGKWRLFW